MREDAFYQPRGSARDATFSLRVVASKWRALCLILAIAIFGWGQTLGFAPVTDLLSKVVIVLLVLIACAKRGGAVTWLTLFFGVLLFVEVRSVVHLLGVPPHTGDLQELERTLFFGTLPSQFLQETFFNPRNIGPLDCFATLVDWSYFLVPYVVVFRAWLDQPYTVHRLVHPLVLTFLASVVIYGVLPATPPWLASAELGAPQIYRVMHLVGAALDASIYARVYQSIGDPNPTAALPSVHFAITFVLFLYTMGKPKIWTVIAGAYAAVMLISLVYLGEHYVTDTILGATVATAVWYGYQRIAHWRVVARLIEADRIPEESPARTARAT